MPLHQTLISHFPFPIPLPLCHGCYNFSTIQIWLSWDSCHLPLRITSETSSRHYIFVVVSDVVGALPQQNPLLYFTVSLLLPRNNLLYFVHYSNQQLSWCLVLGLGLPSPIPATPSLGYIHPWLYNLQLRGCWSSSRHSGHRVWGWLDWGGV